MRKRLSVLFCLVVCGVSAMSIGRNGASFEDEAGHLWQPVHYEDRDAGFEANIPGDPVSGQAGPWLIISSRVEGTRYEIHTLSGSSTQVPLTYEETASEIEKGLGSGAQVTEATGDFGKAKHVVEFEVIESGKSLRVGRAYVSANKAYYMVVEGQERPLADAFFNSMIISK